MKQINSSKLIFMATIGATVIAENQYLKCVLKKCHYL